MPKVTRKLMKESGAGKLYEANGFLVPVLTGSPTEMGVQYGDLMVEYMQKAYDVLIEPGRKKGTITDDTAKSWTERVYTTGSSRYRQFYDGLAEATGWPLEKVGILDNLMENAGAPVQMFDLAGSGPQRRSSLRRQARRWIRSGFTDRLSFAEFAW